MHIQRFTISELDQLSERLGQMADECPDHLVRFALIDLMGLIANECLSRAVGPELARDLRRQRDPDKH